MSSLQRQPLCFLGNNDGNYDDNGDDNDVDNDDNNDDDNDDECQVYNVNLFESLVIMITMVMTMVIE